jgi:hypothetical protein
MKKNKLSGASGRWDTEWERLLFNTTAQFKYETKGVAEPS